VTLLLDPRRTFMMELPLVAELVEVTPFQNRTGSDPQTAMPVTPL
jgi:hypothetical protein